MATKKIKLPKDNQGNEYYPATTTDAVVHPTKRKSMTAIIDESEKKADEHGNAINEINETLPNKVDRTDNAPELTSGFAGNLVGRGESASEEIGFRPSGGLTSVNDGAARIERLKGNTVVWNQKNINANFSNGTEGWSQGGGANFQVSNGVATFYASNNNSYIRQSIAVNYISGHKYLFTAQIKSDIAAIIYIGTNGFVANFGANLNVSAGVWTEITKIATAPEAVSSLITFVFTNTVGATISIQYSYCYDLTQMFGAGNEPTTIEEFNARKPLGIDEYAYNEGELISTTADEIKSVGFNAWDGQRRGGYLDGASFTAGDGSSSHTSNFVKVIPGATYYKNKSNVNQTSFYDRNKSFLVGKWLNKGEFTIPNDCHFIKVDFPTADADSFCINLSHTGYRNGEYEPYEEFRRSLPISEIKDSEGNQLFPNGLLSAGSVHDEITATKAIKRIGMVDMGSLTWYYTSEIKRFNAIIPNVLSSNAWAAQLVCPIASGYGSVESNNAPNWKMGLYLSRLYIRCDLYDSEANPAAAFKAAMSGVMLYYELAEPIEVDLPEPINMDYEVSDFGTEEVLSDTPTTPLKADIIYQFNAVDRIRENSLSLEDLIKRVAALEAQNAALVQQLNATGNGETE